MIQVVVMEHNFLGVCYFRYFLEYEEDKRVYGPSIYISLI
jgi:hypothetical protein